MKIDYQKFVMPALVFYVAALGFMYVSHNGLVPMYAMAFIITAFAGMFAWNRIAPRIMGDVHHEIDETAD